MIDFGKLLKNLNDPEYRAKCDREQEARWAAQKLVDTARNAAVDLMHEHHETLSTKERSFMYSATQASAQGYLPANQHRWLMDIAERLQPGFKQAFPGSDMEILTAAKPAEEPQEAEVRASDSPSP
ncbi:hypothetical protein [Ralstonia sp. ASV6]|uniref:hypothetical protein n=1 Tax=Ralstonia sp. ASV6 TaxID=2795124 RepID=UPI0018EA5355|nr:hypothetical protein [Ralstonia sp. ASV6]